MIHLEKCKRNVSTINYVPNNIISREYNYQKYPKYTELLPRSSAVHSESLVVQGTNCATIMNNFAAKLNYLK